MLLPKSTMSAKAGAKAAKHAVKHPRQLSTVAKAAAPATKIAFKAGKPYAKRRARRRIDQLDRAARNVGELLAVRGPEAAYELGLAERPKQARTAPRLAAGAVLGAGAMYLFEPGNGRERREKLTQLVG